MIFNQNSINEWLLPKYSDFVIDIISLGCLKKHFYY